MPYVPPSDEEITYSAQVIIHAERGGPQVVFPKPDDEAVKDKIEELKKERADKIAEEKGEVPSSSTKEETEEEALLRKVKEAAKNVH